MEQRIQAIYQALPATRDQAVLEAGRRITRGLVALLATLRSNIAAFDQRIAELVDSHPDAALFTSLPGAGDVLVPRLIVAFGTHRDRYQSAHGDATLQRDCPGEGIQRQKPTGALPFCLSQVSTPDVPRVCRPLDRTLGVGQSVL